MEKEKYEIGLNGEKRWGMGNNITISFNNPFDKSQEIVLYPEIGTRQRPSQDGGEGVSPNNLENNQDEALSAQDGMVSQLTTDNLQTFQNKENDKSFQIDKHMHICNEETCFVVEENKGNKQSKKWWRRFLKNKISPKETPNQETPSVDSTLKEPSSSVEETELSSPPGSSPETIEKRGVLKYYNNKYQASSSKKTTDVVLPSRRNLTNASKYTMKINQNLPSSSRQRYNNFSYNLRELPSNRQKTVDNSGKHIRGNDQKPPLPSNQNNSKYKREPPKQAAKPPRGVRKNYRFGQNITEQRPLPSQQNANKYTRGTLKPLSYQEPMPPKGKRENHKSGQNTRKNNQEPPPLPSNQNSRKQGKKPPSNCVRSNVDCNRRKHPFNEFLFRPSLWSRALQPNIIRVPNSRTSIPGTSLEEESRYNHVKTWVLSVQEHFRTQD
ncbi:hypothetical protein LOTGIDRAFT_169896 [Lottia gigantea]|uniref:Uncharacterized protein n=1 Tax=Lottia gigantea TaxID=225164 RepID=V3ZJM7_LOTGI|nr:hypothetical protein LOTGIDRAFT_169896 [Lottia gigantea]ESO82575.1 hypothetical protein LOTGIDRAFT_169896 [Lottia gigantea]